MGRLVVLLAGLGFMGGGCGRDLTAELATTVTLQTALPEASVGRAFRAELELRPASRTLPVVEVIDGELPPGLALSVSETGFPLLSGTPAVPGRFEFTLWVRVTAPSVVDLEPQLSLEVLPDENGAPLELLVEPLPEAELGAAYAAEIRARGGTPPYVFRADGELPPGLILSSQGQLSGSPARAGAQSFGVWVEDASAADDNGRFSLNVVVSEPPTVTPWDLTDGRLQRSYSQNLLGEGGLGGPYTWRLIDGRFPDGLDLRLRRATATVLSGLPTEVGVFAFRLELRDEAGSVGNTVLTVRISDLLRVRSRNLTFGRIGSTYREVLPIENALPPLTAELIAGALPPGLDLVPDGQAGYVLAGRPTVDGTFRFTVRFIDAYDTVNATFFVNIARE